MLTNLFPGHLLATFYSTVNHLRGQLAPGKAMVFEPKGNMRSSTLLILSMCRTHDEKELRIT